MRGAGPAALLMLAGCGDAGQSPAQRLATAEAMMPADARLAGLYRQSCRVCHSAAGTGAPLAGDRQAWDARWQRGEEALLTSVIAGKNAMPAGGQCYACTADDHRVLTAFMAGRGK